MPLIYPPLHKAIGIAALLAAAFFGSYTLRAAETAKGDGNEMTLKSWSAVRSRGRISRCG